ILSHHGELEFGSPLKPQILEAVVLHAIDNMDAKMEGVSAILADLIDTEEKDAWSPYHRVFGSYFMRTPNLAPTSPIKEKKNENKAHLDSLFSPETQG
ncbi:MAG: hypothetical protein ACRCTY_06490, partial [Candidatus Adiutrix sp.]